MGDLAEILSPKSVAIFGASSDERKWGYVVTKRLIETGYTGRVFPVNPKGGEILGLPVYKSLRDVKEQVDLTVIGTRSELVRGAVIDSLDAGAKGILIVTAGFGELGPEGAETQRELVDLARARGARIIGPNCLGMFDAKTRLNASVLPVVPTSNAPIALLGQSGTVAVMLFELADERGLDLRSYIGLGNQADTQFHEWIDHFSGDDDVRLIVCYIEGLKDGRRFLESVRSAVASKPVLVLKSGRSDAGAKSVASHTGSLAGSDRISEAAFKQAGAIRVHRSDELFPAAEALLKAPIPSGDGIVIVTDGGAFAVMAADVAAECGLRLADLSETVVKGLAGIIPPHANPSVNPVDTAGGMDYRQMMFADCAEILLADPGIAGLIFVGTLGGYDRLFWKGHQQEEVETAKAVCRLVDRFGKPVIIQSVYSERTNACMSVFYEHGVPVYSSIEHAIRAMTCLVAYGRQRSMPQSQSILDWVPSDRPDAVLRALTRAQADGRSVLMEHESRELLAAYGIGGLQYGVAQDASEAARVASAIGFPVVLKGLSPQIIHKSDVGAIRLSVGSAREAGEAFDEMTAELRRQGYPALSGVIVEEFKTGGIDVIAGMSRDPQFGPVVMFGLGGVMVEALKDVSFRVAPIDESEALKMIAETRAHELLAGYRGSAPRDIRALADLLVRVGRVGLENPEIESLDINPVASFESGYSILDARVVVGAG